jgi:hypothetical protein
MGRARKTVLAVVAGLAAAAVWTQPHRPSPPGRAPSVAPAPSSPATPATPATAATPQRVSLPRSGAELLATAERAARQAPRPRATQADTATDGATDITPSDAERAEQHRINTYLHGEVIPRLRACWRGLAGPGAITFRHVYVPRDGRWVPADDDHAGVELDDSSLDESQDDAAIACMREAVRGTSWPVADGELAQPSYTLYWRWPVPFPDEPAPAP